MNEDGDVYLKRQCCGIEEIGMVSQVAPGVTFLYILNEELYEGLCSYVYLNKDDSVKQKRCSMTRLFLYLQSNNNFFLKAQLHQALAINLVCIEMICRV